MVVLITVIVVTVVIGVRHYFTQKSVPTHDRSTSTLIGIALGRAKASGSAGATGALAPAILKPSPPPAIICQVYQLVIHSFA